jgi:hypothetical protein
MGSFVLHLLILLAQLERSWISSRTKEAWAALKDRGYKHTQHTSIPAGWKRIGSADDKRLVPDKKEREYLTKAYHLYMGGENLERVSNWLYFKGHRRHRGTMYKPEFLPFAFWCYRAGWPKGAMRPAFDKEMRHRLDGGTFTREFMVGWLDEMFDGSGAVVEDLPELVEAGDQPTLGSPGVTSLLPSKRSEAVSVEDMPLDPASLFLGEFEEGADS